MKGRILLVVLGFMACTAALAEPIKESKELIEKGKKSYATNCAVCHAEGGDASSPAAQAMSPRPRNLVADSFKNGDSAEQIFATVTNGLSGTAMAAFSHISEEERWGISYFVKSLRKASAKPQPAKSKKK